jgi:hypothetical protein
MVLATGSAVCASAATVHPLPVWFPCVYQILCLTVSRILCRD